MCRCWLFVLFYSFSFSSVADNHVAVILYDGEFYTGDYLEITGDTPSLGSMDRRMSSFQVSPGYTLRFYLEDNFQGDYYSLDSNVNDVAFAERINNQLRSVKVLKYDTSAPIAVTIFDNTNYSGNSLEVRGDMASLDSMDKKMGSFLVSSGYQVRFYDQENFQGGFYTRDSNNSDDADASSFGGTIRSVKIIKREGEEREGAERIGAGNIVDQLLGVTTVPPMPIVVTLYADENYRGSKLEIYNDTPALGIDWDNRMSSFKVSPEYEVRFFIDENYKGGYYTKSSNSTDSANARGFSNTISSIKIIKKPTSSIATLSTPSSSTLEGRMESGYDYPYSHYSTPGFTNRNWMSSIPDNTQLSLISIPGTHNSLSLYGGDVPQTQSLDVTEQLNMGIRYLDARFKYRNGKLYAYHGSISQYQTFDEFLAKVSTFLDSNPSETVLIRMQNEAGAADNEDAFFSYFENVLDDYKHNNTVPASNNPTLGSVRGKFVFIRDFNVEYRIGIERASLVTQDAYKLTTNWDLHDKWEKIKAHFQSITGRSISLNYLSGSVGAFPYFVASGKSSPQTTAPQLWTGHSTTSKTKYPDFPRVACAFDLCSINFAGTNQLTNSWIEKGSLSGNLGIVVMDFPGARLVDNIIQTNYRFISTDQSARFASDAFIIYSHNNQQAQAMEVKSDLPRLGDMDNRMSSYQIPTGWEVRFYEGENFKGDYWTRKAGKGNARDGGFDNMIGSIRIIKR